MSSLTIHAAREGLRQKKFSSVELARAFLDRIRQHNPRLNAFITVDENQALAMAAAADERMAKGEDTPVLGVPIALKDVLMTKGLRTTAGSKILENFVPTWDATPVARLRAAGAVFLGKTNTDEFAMGSSTENSAYGVTRNPHDETRVPGGSSGGSAAAVAADLCCAALGTDTGGSVRQPASLCGVSGIKNSYGRVSRNGLIAYGSSLDSVGALAKDVRDLAILDGVMAGADEKDSTSVTLPVPNYVAALNAPSADPRLPLKGLRVGVPKEYFIDGMQAEVAAAVREGIAQLERLGAVVKDISLPNTALSLPVYYIIAPCEASANLARFDGVKYGLRVTGADLIDTYRQTRGAGFGSEVKRRIMLGTYALSAGYYDAYYIRAQKVRTLIKQDFERAFEQVDVIVAPVSPTTAFKIGEKADDPIQMYLADVFTLSLNLAGNCAVCVPCGKDSAGLPIGMQVMGPMFGEEIALRTAHVYQQS
ncbi:MAG TPA: Asp-tRNA(Asn)/Glu-tRNA(Gln) amidotransferase subunit GatA [Thermoflexales bacterium]|nr:Asp-tRNA(Asn)/Glu-tRNA(Gln) amidotransferase subunit GatA [Thermoflexales bacterium]HQW34116.1 Asp-tRNA(Asn)/Glu-tRNA(Gln) amidotransferase subunit GatA [Thermoflexales bacterium]HQZ20740.1 Asp-tRNA(Asn)/Glu-tRNA(Gln) amidotransferase subunit GatA [Thermoflexales bacterium]HQZ99835.1 Asp-tRNA(Asn)/Glu-tRNA(Gln) amidotransferase subunit GatA [Thermoflexales bacterium]